VKLLSASLAVVALAGCTISTDDFVHADAEILGVWEMTGFSAVGEELAVAVGVNAANTPWIEFDGGGGIRGDSGCNGFEDLEGYSFVDGVLDPAEVLFESAACVPEELMTTNVALSDALWSENEIKVTFGRDSMRWEIDGEVLKFVSVDEPPTPPTPAPQTSVGSLDCAPDPVQREKVPAEGTDAEELALQADSEVAEVVVEDTRKLSAEGYGADGELLLVVLFDDIKPETFSIYTCP